MATSSLLALIDDIATVLDDVAVLSKVAAKKTAGVLGDDLALNAEQVTGVRADRELPVVWAVTKGSLLNKLILVPAALLISAFIPWAVMVLLMLGGAYLCFEGFEKIAHKLFHKADEQQHKAEIQQALLDPQLDLKTFEQDKIKGAIRTDFVLSAEIIVIVLGTVSNEPFLTQVSVLSLLALLFTLGVYGFVAAIVKLDDVGLYLSQQSAALQATIGRGLLAFAPWLMKALSVVGTIAMFLVGGGILMHGIPGAEHWLHGLSDNGWVQAILPTLAGGLTGLLAGGLLVGVLSLLSNKKTA
ncbi:DUF808 domain-containing protein [Bacterioplanoides pacificum]|uniref:DUF808 domain-containing protein n=1 Tax=Bacterioplanoides pacificum TaxID=1171596 RepID=A0ABV7VVG8_9GAMM